MIRYSVTLHPQAKKAISALAKNDNIRISTAIELLRDNPIPPKALKLQGRDGYRIRVGKFRVIYTFDGKALVILVLDIGPRRDIYNR